MRPCAKAIAWLWVLSSHLAVAKPPESEQRKPIDLEQHCSRVGVDASQGAPSALLAVRAFRLVCGGRPLPSSFTDAVRAHQGSGDDDEQATWTRVAAEQALDAAAWETKSAEWLRASAELRLPPRTYVDATSWFCAASTVVGSTAAGLCDEALTFSATLDGLRGSRRGARKLTGLFETMIAQLRVVERNRARLLRVRYQRRTSRETIESFAFAQLLAQVADKIIPDLLAVAHP